MPSCAARWEKENFSPLGESQHRVCLDTGFRRRPAKRFSGQKPGPTLERRNDEQGHHIKHPNCVRRSGHHQAESKTGGTFFPFHSSGLVNCGYSRRFPEKDSVQADSALFKTPGTSRETASIITRAGSSPPVNT